MTSVRKLTSSSVKIITVIINYHLGHGDIVVSSVEDGRIIIDIPDLDGDGADVLQGGLALVARLHRHVDQLLSLRLVSVENLKIFQILENIREQVYLQCIEKRKLGET